ncbi:very short patch repair endonuclease [Microvirga yunnanensis]|uniref:very short patch repair endonuclease n=1 Tax=Microvirga yunnanensis TaxID=2953740 RepID=UPI0021C5C037|nr:very short patch repair endonuclease [Microvirga sp. HBU65207]
MVDRISKSRRSENMRRIRSRDTQPELAVRKALTALKVRYRIHYRQLPGTPDIAIPRLKLAINVHGCFWHRHPGCPDATMPKTNTEFWETKFSRNVERDARKREQLEALGWRELVIWECETEHPEELREQLSATINAYSQEMNA